MNADIIDFDEIKFNKVTREIQSTRSLLIPNGLNADNVNFVS